MLDPSRPFRVRVLGSAWGTWENVEQTFHWPAELPLPMVGNRIQVDGCDTTVEVLSITFSPNEALVTMEVM